LIKYAAAFLALLLTLPLATAQSEMLVETVVVVTASGKTEFQTEIAATEKERETGLMFRRHLPANRAMLFDFGTTRDVAMWMKNTYIPLDMIFIAADGRVKGIVTGKPHSRDILSVGVPVRAVLEVAGGTAKRIGLAKGDRVLHRIFTKDP
jgi:uncharacterized membrane protein (UPF0127 family)